MKKNYLNILLSTISLIAVLTSCSKDDIAKDEAQTLQASEESYKQKFNLFITKNNNAVQQLGIDLPKVEKIGHKEFKSYQEAYEFFEQLKKGVTSTQKDTAIVARPKNKGMSTMFASWGVDNYTYSNNCSNVASVSGSWGTSTITGTWSISGTLGYSYTQSSPNASKIYNSVMPSGTSLSDPFMAYSGVGSITASAGGWNGSAASYTMDKHAQISYTIAGIHGSAAIVAHFSTGIGWSPSPGQVYISHSMSAQAY